MEKDTKRLERIAKSLLLRKKIPSSKMDIVRSLMRNDEILPEEKYTAIIDLIQSCPDKPVPPPRHKRVELREPQRGETIEEATKTEEDAKRITIEPIESSVYVHSLYRKYKKLKFFKKRYLKHAGNRFGFKFKKRLIPSKRLLKVLKEISSYQEEITV